MHWVFHCPKEARGIGYYSGRWAANSSLQYTDDKLFMYAYKLFGEKYKKSTEGARQSEDTPPGRKIEFSWTDDSNVFTNKRPTTTTYPGNYLLPALRSQVDVKCKIVKCKMLKCKMYE